MEKNYIVRYTKIDRRGSWRNYSKEVVTDDIVDYIDNEMKLSHVTARPYGSRKGLFISAVEVEKSNKALYKFRSVPFGEYWYNNRDGQMVKGMSSDLVKYYD